jgi:hypothetical protein
MFAKRLAVISALALSLPSTGLFMAGAATAVDTQCVSGCSLNSGSTASYAQYVRESDLISQDSDPPEVRSATALCDQGDDLLGGGHQIGDLNGSADLLSEGPTTDEAVTNPNQLGWAVVASLSNRDTLKAIAYCRDTFVAS